MKLSRHGKKKINIALQGGGSHGAFTWGVLDEFLRDGRLHFDSISATSAGSMNAAVMLYGLHTGGPEGACDLLEKFWKKVSEAGSCFNPLADLQNSAMETFFPWMPKSWLNNASQLNYLENLGQTISPYRANPLNINPLRDILKSLIDFNELQKAFEGKVFISATNVHLGEVRVFTNEEITEDVLMASATLPYLFQAIEIDGQHYWDGGYTGNPPLWPLYYKSEIADLMIVHVNPVYRPEVPKESYEIENRINEITFNAAMIHELRAIHFVQKLVTDNMLMPEFRDQYQKVRMHALRSEDTMRAIGTASKFDTSWDFLTKLRDAGREVAKNWLAENFEAVGHKGTVDIETDYLTVPAKVKK